MRVCTENYVATHGKAPKGFGLWFFSLGRNGSWTDVSTTASYTDAKKWAVKQARELGCTEVVVLP